MALSRRVKEDRRALPLLHASLLQDNNVKHSGLFRFDGSSDESKYVNMVLNVHRNHNAYWGRGEGGERGMKREVLYISLYWHDQNDSCNKMGSDESHSNVSVIVTGRVT